MNYLQSAEYAAFGLSADTSETLVVAASAMIDAFCRRPSLGIQPYTERLRVSRDGCSVQLSNTPLAAVDGAPALLSVQVRQRRSSVDACMPLSEAAAAFASPGTWIDMDVATVSFDEDGLLTLPRNLLGIAYAEARVTYTAGHTAVPVPVKVACAQIVRNAQATPALNVQRQTISGMQMEYFRGALLDDEVQRLLLPFRSQRWG